MDRRRINGPSAKTTPPVFVGGLDQHGQPFAQRPQRQRPSDTLRKIFLKTGVTPSASGSAYLELSNYDSPPTSSSNTSNPSRSLAPSSALKVICTVHGPHPLPRSAPFSPHLILSAHIKYAPFASQKRRGHLRDSSERDLAVHLETALRGVVIGDRWPKSGVEVIVTILEGEEDRWAAPGGKIGPGEGSSGQWGAMSALAGCITVASAAITDAGIDCVDLVAGGVAALVRDPSKAERGASKDQTSPSLVLDPVPSEHSDIQALCVVGYLPSRDEITNLWMNGDLSQDPPSTPQQPKLSWYEDLTDSAVQAALGSYQVLAAALKEAAEWKGRS